MSVDIVDRLSVPRPLWIGKPIVGVVIVDYIPDGRCLLVDSEDRRGRYVFCNQEFYDELVGYLEFKVLNLPVYDKEKIKDILDGLMERNLRRPLNPIPIDINLNPFRW